MKTAYLAAKSNALHIFSLFDNVVCENHEDINDAE